MASLEAHAFTHLVETCSPAQLAESSIFQRRAAARDAEALAARFATMAVGPGEPTTSADVLALLDVAAPH